MSEKETTIEDEIKQMVFEVSNSLKLVHEGSYNDKNASRTAALALKCQIDMAEILSDAEASAKGCRNDVRIAESQAYFEAKEESDKKLSEAALEQHISKNPNVLTAEKKAIQTEKSSKKWTILSNTMKEAHIFFRMMNKQI